jgi:hypothetical protein
MNVEPTGTNPTVTGAIRQAARMTGADFKYLLATAQVESNLNPNAQAATSSARGLFQFTEQTWLTTLKEQGGPLGYGPYANAISRQPSGDYAVSDPSMTRAVMNLRSDPNANALMAGAFTKLNADKLADRLGRGPTEGELYVAHFLGPDRREPADRAGRQQADDARRREFPERGPRQSDDLLRWAGERAQRRRRLSHPDRTLPCGAQRARRIRPNPPAAVAATAAPSAPRTGFAPDTASLTETYAAAARLSPTVQAAKIGPVFHGLFRSTGGPEPVAPLVNSLWTSPTASAGAIKPASVEAAAGPVAATEPAAAPQAAGGELGLFQDQVPDARALFRGRV